MKLHHLSLIAGALLTSCNLTESVKSNVSSGPRITPRLVASNGQSLPVTDSVHVKVWSTSPATIWYEKTLPWSAKFVVISGVPAGTEFTLAMEGRAKQPDSSQAVWWSGSQTGTASQPQTVDAQVLTVPVAVRDTVAPKITALSKDTALDSTVSGVRLRWRVTDDSLATVSLGTNSLTPASDIVSDSVTVAVGGSTKVVLKAVDKSGNVSLSTITVSRKSTSGLIIVSGIPWNELKKFDTLIDARDGQKYRTITIGSQTWMAQNLNYRKSNTSSDTVGVCMNSNNDSCTKYGRLYTWNEATANAISTSAVPSNVQGACPSGWFLPSDGDFKLLESFIGISSVEINSYGLRGTNQGNLLRSNGGWDNSQGADTYGFRALKSGAIFEGTWDPSHCELWTGTEESASHAFKRAIFSTTDKIGYGYNYKTDRMAIRCIKSN